MLREDVEEGRVAAKLMEGMVLFLGRFARSGESWLLRGMTAQPGTP
jgi:hypothetical protein